MEDKYIYQKRYYDKNREKIREIQKKYRESHKEQIKEMRKLYAEKNKEKLAEKRKEYYIKNKEQINERNNLYRLNNKEKVNKLVISRRKEVAEQLKQKGMIYTYLPKTARENKMVLSLSNIINISEEEARQMLIDNEWNYKGILERYEF